MFDDWEQIKLINNTETTDAETGSLKKADVSIVEVMAENCSINRNEFYQAQKNGIKIAAVFRVWNFEYHNENYIEYNGVRMEIERTYPISGTELIELVCKSLAEDY